MLPFRLGYSLSRRQRLAAELYPWLPCLAACLGFTLGVSFLSAVVSRWFLPLLVLPPLVARNFLAFLFDLAVRPVQPVNLQVEGDTLVLRSANTVRRLPLSGIIQVFRSGAVWTVLHLTGEVLLIPAEAITAEQVGFLHGFASRAAMERRSAAEAGGGEV